MPRIDIRRAISLLNLFFIFQRFDFNYELTWNWLEDVNINTRFLATLTNWILVEVNWIALELRRRRDTLRDVSSRPRGAKRGGGRTKLGEYYNVLRGDDRRSEKAVRVREPQRSLHFWDLIGIQSDFLKEFWCLLFAFFNVLSKYFSEKGLRFN